MKKLVRPIYAAETFTFEIPVTWKMRDVFTISANSLKEAVQIINRQEYELPPGQYVPDSFEIDYKRLDNA